MKMVPIFLQAPVEEGGLALSTEAMGTIYGLFGTVAFIVGSILGGYYIAHFGLKRCCSHLCAYLMCLLS